MVRINMNKKVYKKAGAKKAKKVQKEIIKNKRLHL